VRRGARGPGGAVGGAGRGPGSGVRAGVGRRRFLCAEAPGVDTRGAAVGQRGAPPSVVLGRAGRWRRGGPGPGPPAVVAPRPRPPPRRRAAALGGAGNRPRCRLVCRNSGSKSRHLKTAGLDFRWEENGRGYGSGSTGLFWLLSSGRGLTFRIHRCQTWCSDTISGNWGGYVITDPAERTPLW
jgi:hypothetical protein